MSEQAIKKSKVSISQKIDITLILLFVIMLVVSAVYQFSSQRAMIEEMVVDQANGLADSYFDNVNTLMLTGKMAQKEIARSKLTSREEVIDARVLRSEAVSKIYGPAKGSAIAKDSFDKQALAGEMVKTIYDGEEGRRLTIAFPLVATDNFRGTNCLTCHAATEGTILGAVRLDYSLQKLDAHVERQIWTNIGLNTLMLVIGLIVISWILRKLVTRPLASVIRTLRDVESSANLNHRINIRSNDELGEVADGFNKMMEKFSHIIHQVLGSTKRLNEESKQLELAADANIEGTRRQHEETDQVATAFTEMEQTSHEVATNATTAAQSTEETSRRASEGRVKVKESIDSINSLSKDLEKSAQVIKQLEEHSDSIGQVVEVISTIAGQTNLLALNAAIEAARAGEQGRGFAVVADEVRALATRTHESTNEIQTMIEELQSNARQAAEVMNLSCSRAESSVQHTADTGQFLSDITDAVDTLNSLNIQNAAAAEEQQATASEINRNILSINSIADESMQNSHQVAQATHNLLELSENLQKVVGQFNLDDLQEKRAEKADPPQ